MVIPSLGGLVFPDSIIKASFKASFKVSFKAQFKVRFKGRRGEKAIEARYCRRYPSMTRSREVIV